MNRAALGVLLLAMLGCLPPPQPQPTPTPSAEKPPQPGPAPATCSAACSHWRDLSCLAGDPTPGGGVSCEAVCRNIQESGVVELDLECGVLVTSCTAIDACER